MRAVGYRTPGAIDAPDSLVDIELPKPEPGPRDLIVEIRVTLNPDGSVFAMPEILNTTRMASDPFFRAAAESAQRAVLKCSPLRMPSKKYSVWKEVTLRFDPSQMLQ